MTEDDDRPTIPILYFWIPPEILSLVAQWKNEIGSLRKTMQGTQPGSYEWNWSCECLYHLRLHLVQLEQAVEIAKLHIYEPEIVFPPGTPIDPTPATHEGSNGL